MVTPVLDDTGKGSTVCLSVPDRDLGTWQRMAGRVLRPGLSQRVEVQTQGPSFGVVLSSFTTFRPKGGVDPVRLGEGRLSRDRCSPGLWYNPNGKS